MARLVLFSFLVTFMASRVMVYLIMAGKVPDLYLHLGGNHIHPSFKYAQKQLGPWFEQLEARQPK